MTQLNCLGEFKDSGLEKKFRAAQWPCIKQQLQFIYRITAILYILASFGDYYELGPGIKFTCLFMGRCIVSLTGMVAFYRLRKETEEAAIHTITVSTYMAIVIGTETMEVMMKAPITSSMGIPATAFIILVYYLFFPLRRKTLLIGGVAGSTVYIATMLFMTPLPFASMSTTILCFCLANGCGIYFFIHMEKTKRCEFTAIATLKALVEIDELTHVFSRRKAFEMGRFFLKSARRFNTNLSVLMLDIDHFKRVNDTFGHHTGDMVLKEMAHRCKNECRDVDAIGRLGGEEFIIFLPQSHLSQALNVAERIRKTIGDHPFEVKETKIPITISIGAVELSPHHTDLSALVHDADVQLYRAKKLGRNRVYHNAA